MENNGPGAEPGRGGQAGAGSLSTHSFLGDPGRQVPGVGAAPGPLDVLLPTVLTLQQGLGFPAQPCGSPPVLLPSTLPPAEGSGSSL